MKDPKIPFKGKTIVSNPPARLPPGLLALLVLTLLVASPILGTAEEYRSPADGIQLMKYEDGRLSLEAKDALLDKVLTELSRMALLTIIADGPIEGRITLYADRLPLEKALRKILRGKDTSFVYTAKAETSPAEYEIMEVRIYLPKADKGEARRYSYSRMRNERKRESGPSSLRREYPRSLGTPPRPSAGVPPIPGMPTSDEAKRLISELAKGNLKGLDEITEKFKKGTPQAEEQIQLLLKSIDDARARAGERGAAIPPLEGMDGVQDMLKQMLQPRRMSPGQEGE